MVQYSARRDDDNDDDKGNEEEGGNDIRVRISKREMIGWR